MSKFAGRTFTVSMDGGSTVFPQLREFGAFGSTRNLIDATAYGDDWNDYVTGLQDGDEVPFTLAYDPADSSHQDLVDAYNNTDGRITLTVENSEAAYEADISCIISQLRVESPIDGLFALSGVFKIVEPGVVMAT